MRLLHTLLFVAAPMLLSAQSSYRLVADGTTDTYSLIEQAGFFAETTGKQTPDDFMCHPSYRHISQTFDETLGRYVFAFDIHVDYQEGGKTVTDGNKSELTDRQRNEIKCMDSVKGTVAKDGETISYRWLFLLPEGMKTTGEFCHIHQIKGMGSGEEVAHPVFTLTCRTTGSSKQVLQVINVPYEGSSNVNLAQTDLKPLLGKWVEATEVVTVGRHGRYSLTLRDVETGKKIVAVEESDIMVWRDTNDASTMRGKWGIYRSLGQGLSLKSSLRSERVLFADFEALKGDINAGVETVEQEIQDNTIYDLTGRRVENPGPGMYIQNRKVIIIK